MKNVYTTSVGERALKAEKSLLRTTESEQNRKQASAPRKPIKSNRSGLERSDTRRACITRPCYIDGTNVTKSSARSYAGHVQEPHNLTWI